MEVTVREKHWHGQYTYEPVCEMSKMLAEVSNQKNLSMRMIKTLRKYCILVKILPEDTNTGYIVLNTNGVI